MPPPRFPEDSHEQEIRRALLQRLADDMALISDPRTSWGCCWLSYEHADAYHGRMWWGYRLCNPRMPGGFGGSRPCEHWHHRHEVFMA